MSLTRRQAIRRHRMLWGWLADNPGTKHKLTKKSDWPGWEYNGGRYAEVDEDCFLCEYAFRVIDMTCPQCPLDWGEDLLCVESIYLDWCEARTPKTRSKYAEIIRDLPVRRAA